MKTFLKTAGLLLLVGAMVCAFGWIIYTTFESAIKVLESL